MEQTDFDEKGKHSPVEQLQQKPAADEFLIVGIGASAGGIQALQQFFKNVPEDSGIAYVVILHLSPDHDSQLAQVLQRDTRIPVTQVTEKVTIQPNHIYVVPPNQHLTIEDGFIAVSNNTLIEERRAPVDIFFRTLADQHGPRAIAVILSGTGANGSMGLKRIKERGGACFVQNPREAEFNEMPRNSIATEMVDEVLNVADIPAKIITYKKSLGTVQITEEAEKRPEEQQQALREIFTQLRVRTGHDFSNYKRPTLLRRIERRINIRNLLDLPSYAKYLHENLDESAALLKDLLISVTNFFRDKKAFDVLEQEILPLIFDNKTNEDQVRVWVAGCATGEEAYTIAMLCAEKTMGAIDMPKVQIFATDIDESSIAQAREGLYTLNDTADISPERMRRFFNKEGDCFRIRREIREMIMFANHNFLKDPPFSHLDLVSCRNVMIYLNHVAQERVIETFHFALNPGAFLFLGTSESVDGASDLYASYNRENHIFQSRQVGQRSYPVPESTPALYFDKFKKDYSTQESENKILERISFGDLHQQLLEEYAPPSLVVNEEYDILHLTERAGKYLQIGGGELSQNLLKLVKTELRLELRSALYQAVQRQSAVEARGLQVNIDDVTETINIHVRPVLRTGDTAKGFILVVFEPSADGGTHEILLSGDEPVARQLEEELIRVKSQLRAANEQHDFQAEEMKASNEELQAMNEELRSAAEELETSKEELQSINEELRTVNQELKVKIEETSIASNNLSNLINSTDIGTIFLDRSFRVVLFTPAARNIFNLIPADYGRPLTDITHRLEHDGLLHDAETVLEKLTTLEKEVRTKEGRDFLMRFTPYRTDEDRIKGVVMTFVDITQRKKADEAKRISEEKYRTLFNSIDEAFALIEVICDHSGKPVDLLWLETNAAFERNTGFNGTGKKMSQVVGKVEPFWYEVYDRVIKTGEPQRVEYTVEQLGKWYRAYLSLIGGIGSRQVALVFDDITERKRREANLAFLAEVSEDLVQMTKAEESLEILGEKMGAHYNSNRVSFVEIFEKEDKAFVRDWHRPDLSDIAGEYRLSQFLGEPYRNKSRAGETVVVPDVHQSSLVDGQQLETVFGIVSFINIPLVRNKQWVFTLGVHDAVTRNWRDDEVELLQELTARIWARLEKVRAEEALRQSEEKYRTLFNSIDEGFAMIDLILDENGKPVDTYHLEANPAYEHHTGLRDIVGKRGLEVMTSIGEWLNFYGDIARTGEAQRLEYYVDFIDRWLSCHVSRVGGEGSLRLAVVFTDITERKQREEQQKFLLKLSDGLRSVADPVELQHAAMKLLVEQLHVMRAGYYEVEADQESFGMTAGYEVDAIPMPKRMRLSDYSESLSDKYRSGRTQFVCDSEKEVNDENKEAYRSLGVRAWAAVPLVKNGQLVAVVGVHSKTARDWTPVELKLLEDLAEQTWAAVERARAQEALRKSEQRLQRIVNIPRVGVLTFDYNGKLLHANDAFIEMLGYNREEFDAQHFTWRDFTPPQYVVASLQILEQIKQTKRGGPYEKEYILKDGSLLWMMFVAADLEDGTIVEYAVDISERKEAEAALRESEVRLQLALDSATMGTFVYYPQEDRGEPDDKMLSIFGLQPGGKLNLNEALTRIIHPDDRERYANDVAKAVDTKGDGKLDSDIRIIHPDGSLHWVNVTGQVIFEDGKAVRMPGVSTDITERKEAEEIIQKSETQLRALVENLPGGAVFIVDKDLRYLLAEGEALSVAGTKAEEFIGKTVDEVVYDEIIDSRKANYLKAFAGESFIDEHSVNDRTFISRGVPLTNAAGEVYAVLAISYDITERKKAEEALRESEERLQKAVQIKTVGVIFFDDKGTIHEANDAFLEMTGYTQEQVDTNKLTIKTITPPEWIPAMDKAMQEIITKGIANPYEKELIRRDGSRFWGLCAKARVSKNEIVEYIIDVTKRKEAEDALQQSEERYRIALTSADMAAWDWDIKQDRIVWNDQHFYLFGVQPLHEELRSDYFLKFIHTDDLNRIADSLVYAIKETGVYREEFRIVRADNKEERWMSGYGKALTKEKGQATRMIGVMFDITERKKLEQQKEDFISIASHELKTPVTSIKAYAEVLHDMFDEKENPQSADLMKKMDAQVDRLIDLIRALLDTSKLSEGEMTLHVSTFDLCNLVEERVQDLQRLSSAHHLIIQKPKETIINADRERIGQVLTNFISNAIKYSPKGGDVIINWKKVKGEIQVSVKDSGIGISKEAQEKVFDRFFRVKTEQMKSYPGMGLGLYITAHIVHRHGGRIWVESEEGKGSTFYFALPSNQ